MMPWWERAEWLDGEIQSILNSSEFTVYMDAPHNCIHIMRSDGEFTSVLFPLNDDSRDHLRQQAFLLHNGINEDEVRRIKDANEKVDAYNQIQIEEAKQDWRDESIWEYQHRFDGKTVTPMVIVPGSKE